jgi:PAS domain S-box-containing protein
MAAEKPAGSPNLRERADGLQREVDRRILVARGLHDRLDDQARRGEQSDEMFRLLVESVTDYAIFILDPTGRVATWNAGAERFKGYRAEEIINRHFSVFYPEEDVRAGKCELELEGAAADGRFEDEGWRLRKDGTRFWANVVITALRDTTGKLVGFGKVTRDLTERRRTEEERAARLSAEHANKTKDEFLAILGHELRNPLAPIVSALQLLKLRGDSQSVREHQIIERQVNQMSRLVDDLLDVSRISQGKIELKREPIELRDPLAKAVEIAIPLFERKSQVLDVVVPEEALRVVGDDARLVQVFTNLLTNASKYTPEGGHVTLSVRHEGPRFAVEIRDDGDGIPPELLPRVFELFVQGEQDVARPAGGLGVGLTLVRALVELHGGSIEAHSAGRGKGSAFVVYLDAAPLPAGASPARMQRTTPASLPPTGYRVLIVDDNEDARVLLADILRVIGHDVQTAPDAREALDVVARFAPQFALLDIGLPEIDGFELAERIRATPGGLDTRLVAISGYGQAADKARAAMAGFDAHLTKPVEVRQVLAHLVDPRRD